MTKKQTSNLTLSTGVVIEVKRIKIKKLIRFQSELPIAQPQIDIKSGFANYMHPDYVEHKERLQIANNMKILNFYMKYGISNVVSVPEDFDDPTLDSKEWAHEAYSDYGASTDKERLVAWVVEYGCGDHAGLDDQNKIVSAVNELTNVTEKK